ncbi:MAG: flagellar biosynthesis protein FliQ [Candidatus Omnitrophica bacterium]|nr:flagellar biosynthesis protein FliQ [Candidatus Omnitrophota bacterium]
MNELLAIGIIRNALLTTLLAAAPMLIAATLVGIIVSILQAITQIREMTLTFVPKIVAVFLVTVIFFPWIMKLIGGFTEQLLAQLPALIR